MYFDFYGMTLSPFNNTPDPRFFFNTPDHEEALASLIYAVQERKGFVLVTGEVGAGKTLLSRVVLNRLDGNAKTAVITHTRLTGAELLHAICREFEIEIGPGLKSAQYIQALEDFLLEQYARDRLAVVIIDEAQNLPADAIEELRMLGNLEANDAKLLQVLLLGQPELQDTFRDPSLRQAYQRIFRTFHLRALDRALTRGYIEHRLSVAGLAKDRSIFDARAIDAIFEFTQGIPRLVNQLCDNALLSAFGQSLSTISAEMIADVVDQMMSLNAAPPSPSPGAHASYAAPNQTMTQRGVARGQRSDLRKPTRMTVDEMRSMSREQQFSVVQALHETRAELAAVREQQELLAHQIEESRADTLAVRETRRASEELLRRAIESQNQSETSLRKVIDEASGVSQRVEKETTSLLFETRTRNSELQDQLHLLIGEIRKRDEATALRANDLIGRHGAEAQKAREHFDAMTSKMREQITRIGSDHEQVLANLRAQSAELTARLERTCTESENRAREAAAKAEALGQAMRTRVEAAEAKITESVESGERQIKESAAQMLATRDRIMSEAGDCRAQTARLVAAAQETLNQTRTGCTALLAEIRASAEEQARKAEQALQQRVNEGVTALTQITEHLAESRKSAEQSRDELADMVRRTSGEIEGIRASLETSLSVQRAEIARLSNDAGSIRMDFEVRFDEARASLESLIQEHRRKTTQRADELCGAIEHRLTTAEREAADRVGALQGELRVVGEAASRISSELKETMDTAEARLREGQARLARESETTQKNIVQLVERNRAMVEATRSQVEGLTRQASETSATMRNEISLLKEAARSRLDVAGRQFEELLAGTAIRVDNLRQEAETTAGELGVRLSHSAEDARNVIEDSEKAAAALRRQSKSALSEVRECLVQMNARADQFRRELGGLCDELGSAARANLTQVDKTGERVVSQLESIRESVQKDADANFRRLALFREQVEQNAEQIRAGAAALLDQVHGGAVTLRQHADELLNRAQSGADRLSDTAAQLLGQAQSAASRFREQAEELLKSAEGRTSDVREQIQALTAQLTGDSEDIRQKLTSAKHDLAEAKQQVERVNERSATAHLQAEARAGELLRQAQAIREKSESLLAMPQEIVSETRRQAESLADMSRKITTAIKQLGAAEKNAMKNKVALEQASSTADEKVDVLKRHTERIGQLVGIIRQLYGTLDARIGRLRGRLSEADDLVRNVPREIEHLRAAFDSDALASISDPIEDRLALNAMGRQSTRSDSLRYEPSGAMEPSPGVATMVMAASTARAPSLAEPAKSKSAAHHVAAPSAQPQKVAGTRPAREATSAPAAEPRSTATTSQSAASPLALAAGSLGELVKKNQKLNEWLREMIREEKILKRAAPNSTEATARAAMPGEA